MFRLAEVLTQLTEHKRATQNHLNYRITEHHQLTDHSINWDWRAGSPT